MTGPTITTAQYLDLMRRKGRPSKYRNRPVWECATCQRCYERLPDEDRTCPCGSIDFLRFDSRAEHDRWRLLRVQEEADEIGGLRRQHRWPLVVNGVTIATYVSDFDYLESGVHVVEDVKGGQATRTQAYRIKAKLMRALYGTTIHEVG